MYRSSKDARAQKGRRRSSPQSKSSTPVATTETIEEPPVLSPPITAGEVVAPSGNATHTIAQDYIALKSRFTAPFMIYDHAAKAIIPNPAYSRNAAGELSRVQGVLLSVLRAAQADAQNSTPKELLYHAERAILYTLAATATQASSTEKEDLVFTAVMNDVEAVSRLPQLETFAAQHNAPAQSVAAVAYVLTQGISCDALDSYLKALQERVAKESVPEVDVQRTPEERAALQATANNLADLRRIQNSLSVAYTALPTGAATVASPATEGGAEAAELVIQEYYSLLRWLLAVEDDRRALGRVADAAAAASSDASGSTPGAGFEVSVSDYDPFSGKLVITRTRDDIPWGLMFNASGDLVSISNQLRNSSAAGERLYNVLQSTSGSVAGLQVYSANRRMIRSADGAFAASGGATSDGAETGNISTEGIQLLKESLSKGGKTLHLALTKQAQAELTVPREVMFQVLSQGGEHASGQRVVLMLQRSSTSIKWGLELKFHMNADHDRPAVLQDFSSSLQLSPAAKNFLFDHRGRLQVLQINYRPTEDMRTKEAVQSTMVGGNLLALHLQVIASGIPAERKKQQQVVVEKEQEDASAFPNDDEAEEELDEVEENAAAEDLDEEAARIADDFMDKLDAKPRHQDAVEDEEEAAATLEEKEEEGVSPEAEKLAGDDAVDDVDALVQRILRKGLDAGSEETDTVVEGDDWASPRLQKKVERKRVAFRIDEDEVEQEDETVGKLEKDVKEFAAQDAEMKSVDAQVQEILAKKMNTGAPGAADADVTFEEEVDDEGDEDGDTEAPQEKAPDAIEGGTAEVVGKAARAMSASAAALEDRAQEAAELEETLTSGKKKKVKKDKKEKKNAKSKKADKKSKKHPLEEEEDDADAELQEKTAKAASMEDAPLVELKSAAEAVMEASKKIKEVASPNGDQGTTEPEKRVSLADLVSAPALRFDNQLVINKFDGTAMELERPNVDSPWGLNMGQSGEEIIMTKLPSFQDVSASHPFLKYLKAQRDGKVKWVVDRIGDKDVTLLSRADKQKVFASMRKMTKLHLVLRALTKK